MMLLLSYVCGALLVTYIYVCAQAPLIFFTGLVRRFPTAGLIAGFVIAYFSAMVSTWSLVLVEYVTPFNFPKATLVLPAIIRFLSDLQRWDIARPLESPINTPFGINYYALRQRAVERLEFGSVWGSLSGYICGAVTVLEDKALFY
jgi:hypothetical protein